MRPHFAVVLLAASLVATMDKAELLNQPIPPDRKHRYKPASVQGHVRGAVAVAEEERANREVLNQLAGTITHASLPDQIDVAALKRLLSFAQSEKQLVPILERGAGELDVLQTYGEESTHIQKLVSTIGEFKSGTLEAATVDELNAGLFPMLMAHVWTPDVFFKGLTLREPLTIDEIKFSPRFGIFRAYVTYLKSNKANFLLETGTVETLEVIRSLLNEHKKKMEVTRSLINGHEKKIKPPHELPYIGEPATVVLPRKRKRGSGEELLK